MEIALWQWVAFNVFILAVLALDLGVFHRNAHEVSLREAAIWSAVWVALALAFNGAIYAAWGARPALEFLTGYLIEKSLSVDNIFVFVMVFSYFAVPARYQHRVLFWGILGALVLRGAFIAGGALALERAHWVIYVFGALLLLSAIKLARRAEMYDPQDNPVLRLAKRVLPITPQFLGQRFVVRLGSRWVATPLLLVLLVIETTDIVFALDSIPAIFAVTREPFLVYTSNVFAILGLRSMYFLLAGVVHRFVYLRFGLAAVLGFVGAKMMLGNVIEVPTAVSLIVIAVLIAGAIVASLATGNGRRAAADARPSTTSRSA